MSGLADGRYGVGIIGANPDRGWASAAHIPALRAIPAFRMAAVATTRTESAQRAANVFGFAKGYDDWRNLIADPEVDVVVCTVKVPAHRDIVLAAADAGKSVFCEWPLGANLNEARQMAERARDRGVVGIVGLQGRCSPYMEIIRQLVADRAIGDVISATLVSSLNHWGPRMSAAEAYRTDISNAATALTISCAHTLDALCHCIGPFSEVSARLATQHPKCEIIETGEVVEVTAPDQILLTGRMASGAVVSVHVKTDMANPTGTRFEINGTEGDIVAVARSAPGAFPMGIQRSHMDIRLARGRSMNFERVTIPATPLDTLEPAAFFTAQLYFRLMGALDNGLSAHPDFEDAVRHHELIEKIETSSRSGRTVQIDG